VKHESGLDGVRGIAVALVVWHHIVVRDDDPMILGGWLGVDLFFVLSGFLITQSVIRRPQVGDFLRRRCWRIGPAMIVFLGVYLAVSIGADDAHQRVEWLGAAATQWLNIQGAMGPPFSPHIGHLWSLSAEAQFYLAWGLALALLVRRRAPRPVVIGIVVALFLLSWVERVVLWDHGVLWNRLYLGPDTHAGSLLAGCFIGLLFSWDLLRWRGTSSVLAVLTVPAVALLAWQVVRLSFLDERTYRWGLTGAAIAGAVIVAGAALRVPSPIRPLIELAPVAFLGRISYSVYLWHLPIIEEVSRRSDGDIVRVAVVSVPLTVAVSLVSYVLVERPLMSSAGRARVRAAIG